MSKERLARLHAEVQRFVDDGRHAGAITLIARNGRIVDWQTYGKRDLEAGLPMEKDTICRIYSMSKIVTSVAVLILLEEARFRLDDPIGDTLPELARMKVLTGGTAEKPLLADAKTPITIRHLLTHTSGLTYDFGDGTIDKIFRQVKPFDAASMGEFVERASRLPLAHEPGERFTYGVSTDILGALVEKVSGRSLAEFLEERIWRPLGMKDTGFGVPEAKRGRLAKVYEKGPEGKLQPVKWLLEREPVPLPKLLERGRGPLLDHRRLRPLHADAAERGPARRGAHPLPEDGRADDGQPPDPRLPNLPRQRPVRGLRPGRCRPHRPRQGQRPSAPWGSSAGPAWPPPTRTSTRARRRWPSSSCSTSPTTRRRSSGGSRPSSTRRSSAPRSRSSSVVPLAGSGSALRSRSGQGPSRDGARPLPDRARRPGECPGGPRRGP